MIIIYFLPYKVKLLLNKLQPQRYYSDIKTIILIEDGVLYEKSDAILRLVQRIEGNWKLLKFTTVLPLIIRDYIYDIVAHKRYRIFSKKEICIIPSDQIRKRFLDI